MAWSAQPRGPSFCIEIAISYCKRGGRGGAGSVHHDHRSVLKLHVLSVNMVLYTSIVWRVERTSRAPSARRGRVEGALGASRAQRGNPSASRARRGRPRRVEGASRARRGRTRRAEGAMREPSARRKDFEGALGASKAPSARRGRVGGPVGASRESRALSAHREHRQFCNTQ